MKPLFSLENECKMMTMASNEGQGDIFKLICGEWTQMRQNAKLSVFKLVLSEVAIMTNDLSWRYWNLILWETLFLYFVQKWNIFTKRWGSFEIIGLTRFRLHTVAAMLRAPFKCNYPFRCIWGDGQKGHFTLNIKKLSQQSQQTLVFDHSSQV